jgi:hypothetical protein
MVFLLGSACQPGIVSAPTLVFADSWVWLTVIKIYHNPEHRTTSDLQNSRIGQVENPGSFFFLAAHARFAIQASSIFQGRLKWNT